MIDIIIWITKKKYLKYKSKYLYSKKNQNGGTIKKLYAFRPTINYDDQILIVEAINEDDAFIELSKIDNKHGSFTWSSEYAKKLSIDEIKKIYMNMELNQNELNCRFYLCFTTDDKIGRSQKIL